MTPIREKPLAVYELEITEHGEFGRIVTFICPDCGEELKWVEYMQPYNKHECKCRIWNLIIEARGLPKDIHK